MNRTAVEPPARTALRHFIKGSVMCLVGLVGWQLEPIQLVFGFVGALGAVFVLLGAVGFGETMVHRIKNGISERRQEAR